MQKDTSVWKQGTFSDQNELFYDSALSTFMWVHFFLCEEEVIDYIFLSFLFFFSLLKAMQENVNLWDTKSNTMTENLEHS